jgi:hypothetical protein
MKRIVWHRTASAIGLAASALVLGPAADAALKGPKPPDPMTITIINNDPNNNIYPVLTTGTTGSDLWLRALYGITKADAKAAADAGKPYFPRPNNFRIYINPTGKGIPPNGKIVLTLPFVTQLVKDSALNKQAADQYIDWWAGGHVEIFTGPKDGGPPFPLTKLYTGKDGQTKVDTSNLPNGTADLPKCSTCQPLVIFKDTKGVFKNNFPFQLTEYTLGAINQDDDPPTLESFFGAVDIDVSYVDTIFLPGVMAPYNPTAPDINQVGYVGTPITIAQFRTALNAFLTTYAGWPQFLSEYGNPKVKILKLASTLHASAGDPDLSPPPWKPFDAAKKVWTDCLKPGNTATICPPIRDVRDLFKANYDNYVKLYPNSKQCDQDKKPVPLTDDLMFGHVQGFSPFVENCKDFADENLLADTPGYKKTKSDDKFADVKQEFDTLQYWPDGSFNPYVVLVHGKGAKPNKAGTGYVNALNAYAYSVDDAVGNLQADGSGFYIAVGGTKGLPNEKPAYPPVNVNFGGASDFGEWTKFGVCTDEPGKMRNVNPKYRSIPIYVQAENLDKCPISLLDHWKPGGENVVYSFKLKALDFTYDLPQPPKSPIDSKTHAPINCDTLNLGPYQKRLCCDIYAYAVVNVSKGPDARYTVVPAPYPHNQPEACPPLPPGKRP